MKQSIDMKSFGVFLSRNKFYTLVNVVGFSVSLMFVILIMLYTRQEYSVDKSIALAPRIYTVCMEQQGGQGTCAEGSHWYTQRTIMKTFPQVQMTCGVVYTDPDVDIDGRTLQIQMMLADSTFFRMFSIPLTQGDGAHALDDIKAAVVSETFARKAWGDENPLGKRIKSPDMEGLTLHVTGVYPGMKGTSFGEADIITRFEHMQYINDYLTSSHMGNASGASVFLLAQEGADLSQKADAFDQMYRDMGFWIYSMEGSHTHTRLLPFADRYFSGIPSAGNDPNQSLRGNRSLVNMLLAAGLVILLFSVFNYINLSTAQSGKRAREMATRRLLGAQRSDIALRLMAEGVLMCLLSLVLGTAMAWAASPYVGALLGTTIRMADILQPAILAGVLVLALVVGCASGIGPAIIISRARPIDVVRGTFRLHTRMTLSRVFIVLQNLATTVMVAAALSIWGQTHHLINAPMGYDLDHLLALPSITGDTLKVNTFMNEVKKLPCVAGASLSMGYPFQGGNNNTFTHDGRPVSLQLMYADTCFFKVLGLRVARDNHQADPVHGIWVNRQFLAEMGLKETDRAVNSPALNPEPLPINGVLEDFKIRAVTSDQHPVAIILGQMGAPWNYLVRVKGDEAEALKQVDEVYNQVFQCHIADYDARPYVTQKMQDAFTQERQLSIMVTLFALVATLISVLGLVAMSTYFIGQRQREVAVRKVFGSSSSQVERRLTGTFLSHALVAAVLAAPLAYWLVGRWITTFSYRIEWWPCVLVACITCLLTSLLAVSVQSHMAATANPIDHLKDE